jgi:hypothetical protein
MRSHNRSEHPARQADLLQQDIRDIRGNLGSLIGELNERRRRALDVRFQLRRHPLRAMLTSLAFFGAVGAAGGALALAAARRRRRRLLRGRLRALRGAFRRMMADPDRVAKESPNIGLKILAAGGTSAASVLARRFAQKLGSRRA